MCSGYSNRARTKYNYNHFFHPITPYNTTSKYKLRDNQYFTGTVSVKTEEEAVALDFTVCDPAAFRLILTLHCISLL